MERDTFSLKVLCLPHISAVSLFLFLPLGSLTQRALRFGVLQHPCPEKEAAGAFSVNWGETWGLEEKGAFSRVLIPGAPAPPSEKGPGSLGRSLGPCVGLVSVASCGSDGEWNPDSWALFGLFLSPWHLAQGLSSEEFRGS